MCPLTRLRSEGPLVADELVVELASLVEPWTWTLARDHCHWHDSRSLPRVPETPHLRRDEHWHCHCPPLQPMSSLLRLRLLVLGLLVLLQGLSRQVAELAGRWSGGARLVWLALVDVDLDVMLLVELVHEGPRTCTGPPRHCAWGGPGPSRPCSRDNPNVWA